jgi:hypothetical protein
MLKIPTLLIGIEIGDGFFFEENRFFFVDLFLSVENEFFFEENRCFVVE